MNVTPVHEELIGMAYLDVISKIQIEDEQGDCCGYASCDEVTNEITDSVDVSTLTLKGLVEIEYDDRYNDRRVLNFIFVTPNGSELLLGYELSAGSGSGWSYGAWVSISLGDKQLSSASW